MNLLWNLKNLYDLTLRRIPLVHPFIRSLVWWITNLLVRCLEKLLRFELPPGNIAPWFKLPWLLGWYEKEIVALYKRLIRPGSLVVDVGGHAGYHVLKFARFVGPHGKVFAFEPSPDTFHILQKNVNRRRLKNVVLEQKCVADYSGECQFYSPEHRVNYGVLPAAYFPSGV